MEQNENYAEEKVISLGDLFFLIKKNIIMILVVTAIFTLAGAIYGLKFKKISYTAKAEAIVMADSTSTSSTANYQEYITSTYLINTFNSFIVSNKVVSAVAADLTNALEEYKAENPTVVLPSDYLTLSELDNRGDVIANIQKNATVTSSTNSLIITVKYKASNEALAIVVTNLLIEKTKEIADKYVLDGEEKVYDYKVLAGSFASVDEADASTVEASRGATLVIIICFLVGFIISFGIVLVKYLTDDTFTSKEEFEKMFNINVLTLLPNFAEVQEKGGKKNG